MLLFLFAALVGCSSSAKLEPGDPNLQILGTGQARDSVDATTIYLAEPSTSTYRIVSGDGEGDSFELTREAAERFNAAWADHEGEARTDFWRVEDDGSIVLCAVIDRSDQAISLFDPPLLLYPATLSPGDTAGSESSMKVIDLGNPEKTKESGTATRTIEYVGDESIRTALGTFNALKLTVRFEADLRLANAVRIITQYLVPEIGLVAEDSEERVDVLGFSGRTIVRRIVLVDEP